PVVEGGRRDEAARRAVDAAAGTDPAGGAGRLGRGAAGSGRLGVVAVVPERREKPRPIDERRAQFGRYKEDVKERGKPFYPYAMFHDTVMSLVVVTVIVALACVWKWSSYRSEERRVGKECGSRWAQEEE